VVRGLLAGIRQPALAAQGRHDPTAPVANLDLLRVLPNLRQALVLERSQHVITVDQDKDELFAALLAFLAASLPAAEAAR
jgi:esterase/lipase